MTDRQSHVQVLHACAVPARCHTCAMTSRCLCSYYAIIILLAGHETHLPTNISTITHDKTAATGNTPPSSAALSLAAALSKMSKPVTDIALGRGIPTLPRRMVERMLAWEYIDLAELPPARANVSKESLNATPNVLLIQSFESARNHRRLIPDITTWVQCFSIYMSVLATKHGEYIPELMAYMRDIIRVSKQFKWPAWIIYDTNYRQHMAETGQKTGPRLIPAYTLGASQAGPGPPPGVSGACH